MAHCYRDVIAYCYRNMVALCYRDIVALCYRDMVALWEICDGSLLKRYCGSLL